MEGLTHENKFLQIKTMQTEESLNRSQRLPHKSMQALVLNCSPHIGEHDP